MLYWIQYHKRNTWIFLCVSNELVPSSVLLIGTLRMIFHYSINNLPFKSIPFDGFNH